MSDSSIGQMLSSGTGHLATYSKHLYDSVRSMDSSYVTYMAESSKHLYNSVKEMDAAHIKHLVNQSKELYDSARKIDNANLKQLTTYSKGVYDLIRTWENANQLVPAASISFIGGYLFGARYSSEAQKELEKVKQERDHYKELAETGLMRKLFKSKP